MGREDLRDSLTMLQKGLVCCEELSNREDATVYLSLRTYTIYVSEETERR
jgi:hypothetical protein